MSPSPIKIMMCLIDPPFLIGAIRSSGGGGGRFEGENRLETILHTLLYKFHRATYTVVIWPIFLSHCVYGRDQNKV